MALTKEKFREYQRAYRKSKPEETRQRSRIQQKLASDLASDIYIKKLLKAEGHKVFTAELIELKRIQIIGIRYYNYFKNQTL